MAMQRSVWAILVWFVLAFLGLIFSLITCFHLGYFEFLELNAYDLLVTLATPSSNHEPPIVLIRVKEADIQRLQNWPLSDDQLADVLERLVAAHPKVIGVDIYRDFSVPPNSGRLDHVLLKNSSIIMIKKLPSANSTGVAPPKVLANAEGRIGFSDHVVDPKGIVRRNLIFNTNDGVTSTAFSLMLAMPYLENLDIYPQSCPNHPEWMCLGQVAFKPLEPHSGGYATADTGGYQLLLEYIGGMDPFQTFTLGDLWDNTIAPAALKDKIVIVGVDAESVKDQFTTPHAVLGGMHGITVGIVVHAHAIRQILEAAQWNRSPLVAVEHNWSHAWLVLWIALGLIIAWYSTTTLWLMILMYYIVGNLLIVVLFSIIFYFGYWLATIPALIGWNAAISTGFLIRYSYQKREQQVLMKLFASQVSPQVVKTILERRDEILDAGAIKPQALPATILFSDLQGFTKISESMDPEPFLTWLNKYLGAMTDIIMQHGGVLDDYAGDGIKANFGVPLVQTDPERIAEDARHAVACALDMGRALNRLNSENRASGLPPVGMRIGIHSGKVVVGTVGSRNRMKYTTVGSEVNIASRLESLKDLPGPDIESEAISYRILISPETNKLVKDRYITQSQGHFMLKGIEHAVEIFMVANIENQKIVDV
ncbi:hypothetical protein TI04_05540 [Achromatium sp. WMS2]|nr:hypothetical protein TI04_05540 [Achromatium sp. WMS2]